MKSTIEMAERGQVTIPKALRDEYGLGKGQKFTIVDLGGSFLLRPGASHIDSLADGIRDALLSEGASLEEMLAELRAIREAG